MKYISIALVLLLCWHPWLSAQPCLPDGITFTTQAQIDSFPILHPNCTEIEGWVKIEGGDIANLQGISVVTTMGTYLTIWYNENLIDLSGLDNLTSVGINFTIIGNSSLSDITSLGNLVYVGAALDIIDNSQLISLSGINNIEAESISSLNISYNPQLTYCEVQSVCDYLANPNGYLIIENNGVGCNSPAEVEEACTVGIAEQRSDSQLSIYPNPAHSEVIISSFDENAIEEVNIYNTTGQRVLHQKGADRKVDISGLQQGLYVVEVVVSNARIKGKLIVR